MIGYFMSHQFLAFIIVCVSASVCWRSLFYAKKVLGDEDYSTWTWIFSMGSTVVSFIMTVVFGAMFIMSTLR